MVCLIYVILFVTEFRIETYWQNYEHAREGSSRPVWLLPLTSQLGYLHDKQWPVLQVGPPLTMTVNSRGPRE